MKATAINLQNGDEIDRLKSMGLPIPDEQYRYDDFYFRISKVDSWLINDAGNINMWIYGEYWVVKYDRELVERLKKYFTENE